MLNALELYKEARELGTTKTFTELQQYINEFDYETERAQEKARYRVEIWDKQSLVNGIDPQVILKDVPEGGEVFLIYVDGKLIFLQKHDPTQAGLVPMSEQSALQIADQVVNDMVERVVDAKAREYVLVNMIT